MTKQTLAIQKLTPQDAEAQRRDAGAFLLDVRGLDEFAAGHAAGAVCIPLPDLDRRAGELPLAGPILVMCQSGGRSAQAAERLRAAGRSGVLDVAGGLGAWQRAGLPTERQTRVIPLERQVRIAAGLLVLGFSLLGFFVHTLFFAGAAFIGFMLALTGTLGICPMMSALRLLPWNRSAGTIRR